MPIKPFILACLISIAAFHPANADQSSDRDDAFRLTHQVIDRLRQFISTRPNSSIAKEDNSVDFDVSDSMLPNAFSYIEGTQDKRIEITSGFTLILTYLNEVNLLALTKGEASCKDAYISYLSIKFPELENAAYQRRPLPEVYAPEVLGQVNGGPCSGIGQYYPFSPDLSARRSRSIAAGLSFMYLHELGHHALGHTAGGRTNVDSGPGAYSRAYILSHAEQLRAIEADADRWAVDAMFDLNTGIEIANIPLFDILVLSSGFDPYFEKLASHPLGLRRQIAIMQRQKDRFTQKLGPSGYPQELQAYLNDILRLEQKAEREYSKLNR